MKVLVLISLLLSKGVYERLFPHHDAIYSYDAFLTAAAKFPAFANTGDLTTRKRELAAFLAQVSHESSNTGNAATKADPYAWGLYSKEERGCSDGHCTQYNVTGKGPYQPVPGKSYYGRGPLQLSYVSNYGAAGKALGLPLLEQPELVSHDGVVAFSTALWFWMQDCHEAMTGGGREKGFGATINIINGGRECGTDDPGAARLRQDRIGWYRYIASALRVSTEADCDCR